MDDYGVPQDETLSSYIDWENLFDCPNLELDPLFLSDLSADGWAREVSNRPTDPGSLSINDVEHFLMKDDYDDVGVVGEQPNPEFSNDFLVDIFVESPVESDQSGGASDGKNLNTSEEDEKEKVAVESDRSGDLSDGKNSNTSEEEDEKVELDAPQEERNSGDGDDPSSKKRKRQLRNRDAAMRSRERKKIYVRDLEMKSRYLEAECKRLGMLLQCCFAENQALRISLDKIKAVDASMTKQESAVLLLESLLLGSLLWFLGIVCLFIVPKAHQSTLELVPAESVEKENQGNLAPKKPGSKIFVFPLVKSSIMSKRCKASRSRMKLSFAALEVLV